MIGILLYSERDDRGAQLEQQGTRLKVTSNNRAKYICYTWERTSSPPLTPIRDSDMMDKEFEDKIKTVLYGRPPINFLPQNDDDTTYIEVTHVEPGLGNIPVRAHTTVTATTSDDTATTSIAVTSQISTTASSNTIQTVTAATSSNPDSNNTPNHDKQ